MQCNMTVKPRPDRASRNALGDVKYKRNIGAQFHTSDDRTAAAANATAVVLLRLVVDYLKQKFVDNIIGLQDAQLSQRDRYSLVAPQP